MKTINTFYSTYNDLQRFIQLNHSILFSSNVKSILVQVFSGLCNSSYLQRVSFEISQLVPQAKIIGTTTVGGIMNGKVSGLGTVLSFSVFFHSTIRIGVFPKGEIDDFELGQCVAEYLGGNEAKVLIMFATGGAVDAASLLKGIQAANPVLPIAGGNAGNNLSEHQGLVVGDGQVVDSGVVGVVLESNCLEVKSYSNLGWQPIGKEMTVTKSDGTRVYSIDNIPVYEIYKKYLGLGEKDFVNSFEYPLIVERQGMQIARTPFSRYKDNSILFAGELVEGEKVRLSFGHIDMIAEGVRELCADVKAYKAESIYVYSCESRRGFLQEHSTIETKPLQNIAPTSGFFTSGEFFHSGFMNQLLNATMTVLVLSEGEGSEPQNLEVGIENHVECKNVSQDKVVARSTGVLKTLTHLVDKVTSELIEANEKLKYISLHDAVTGLFNRAAFEQEMKLAEELEGQVGFIMCDLDCLKIINDLLGHDIGDKVLKFAADAITEVCLAARIIARIGGDEFAIIIPNADRLLLTDLRRKILLTAEKIRRDNPTAPLYLSVGTGLKGFGGVYSVKEAFKKADQEMYNLKIASKNGICEDIKRISNIHK